MSRLRNQTILLYVITAFVCWIVHSCFILGWPVEGGGDWDSYGVVAKNILKGHGVSLAKKPPYIPDFGGNALPGYPAFMALVWSVWGESQRAFLLFQAAFMAFSLAVSAVIVEKKFGRSLAWRFGFSAALSPMMMAWSRMFQPQTLAMATVLLFFILLGWGLRRNKLFVIPMAILWALAIYLRSDGVFLAVSFLPFLFSGLLRKNFGHRILMTGGLTVLLVSPWILRCHALGLGLWPPPMLVLDDAGRRLPAPYGFVSWGLTWMSREYERGGMFFPITRSGYDTIFVPDYAYDNENERKRVTELLDELKNHVRMPFPDHINKEFAAIAMQKLHEHPVRILVWLPIKRMFALWIHPGSSFGWPVEMHALSYEERLRLEKDFIAGTLYLLKNHPSSFAVKGLLFLYSVLLYGFAAAGWRKLARSEWRPFAQSILVYTVTMTVFYGFTNNVEVRYMAPLQPLLHFLATLNFAGISPRLNFEKSQS